jgi:hypothetical protein
MSVKNVTLVDKLNVLVTPTKQSYASIKGIYPFRVSFKSLPYSGLSNNNAPGIGIAVIGSTFFIL